MQSPIELECHVPASLSIGTNQVQGNGTLSRRKRLFTDRDGACYLVNTWQARKGNFGAKPFSANAGASETVDARFAAGK